MSKLAKLTTKGSSQIERATNLYRRISAVDVIKSGRWISPSKAVVAMESQDIDNNTKIRKVISVEVTETGINRDIPAVMTDSKVAQHFSPSGKFCVTCIKTNETYRFDVSTRDGLEVSILNAQAQPISDPNLQFLSWKSDETGFVFVGEKHSPKSTKPWELKESTKAEDMKVALQKSTWETKDNWGECFADNSCFTLYYVDIERGEVYDLIADDFSKNLSSVSPLVITTLHTSKVLFTAVDHLPRRLGIVYCRNRPSKTYTISIDKKQQPEEVRSLSSFRGMYNAREHNGKIAFFAQARSGSVAVPKNFPHNCASSLHVTTVTELLDSKTNPETFFESTVVVQIPEFPVENSSTAFYGLYPPTGNDLWWTKNGAALIVGSVARSATKIFEVNVEKKSIDAIQCCKEATWGQWTILDVRDENLLIHHSELLNGSSLIAVQLNSGKQFSEPIGSSFPFQELHETYSTSIIPIPDAHDTEVIYTKHRSDEKRGTLVIVHGGPHSTDTNGFVCAQLLYLLEGWNLFSINYGGSLGFGQHRIQELMGKVGTNDVADCISSIEAMKGKWDENRLVIYGGSHGGFLAGHLTGRYPDLFKAAIIRNPVMNIASAHYETDIPDWTLAVTDVDDDNIDIAKMFDMSPIVHAASVKTATLLGIGLDDKRVLPLQGKAWYHALKAAPGKPTVRMIEYPENSHALDGVHAAADFAIRGVIFASDASKDM